MENPSGEILYRELSYHALITSSTEHSRLKIVWSILLLSVIGLTITGHFLARDVLDGRNRDLLTVRERLVDRLGRAVA